MGVVEDVTEIIKPVVASLDVELVDVEHHGALLRLVVDEPGGGIGVDRLAEVNQAASRALDVVDPIPGRYTLEVSSPGLERPLRTPAHFARAVGQQVALRMAATWEGERRLEGVLAGADETHITLSAEDGEIRAPLTEIERARTVFEWGPGPKPGKGARRERRTTSSGASPHRPADESAEPGRRDDSIPGGHR